MPLTRNQQAALQANGSNGGTNNIIQQQQQHVHTSDGNLGSIPGNEESTVHAPSTPVGIQLKSRNSSTNTTTSLSTSSGPSQTHQQHQELACVLGHPSATSAVNSAAAAAAAASDWVNFGQGSALTDDVFTQEHGNTLYRLSQMQQQLSPQRSFDDAQRQRNGVQDLHANNTIHLANNALFQNTNFNTDPNAAAAAAAAAAASAAVEQHNRQRSDSTNMNAGFATPAPMTRAQLQQQHNDHVRTFSLDSNASLTDPRNAQQRREFSSHHRTPGSVDSTMSMDIDNMEILRQANEAHIIGASPLRRGVGPDSAQSRLQVMTRQNRSLGQVGAAMSGNGDDGLLRLGGPLRATDASPSFDRFGVQQADSARSMSPPEHPHTAFLGNFSPNSSISSHRHAGDSSIDTSTDSVSNSATTMSAVPSQASSISADDFLSSGGKKIPKMKTRLRNIDRKAICEAARDDPKVRQEDLAVRFGIERSTVSKTLKNKEKWLAIQDEGQSAFIMKHRTGKFPDLEGRLAKWINDEVGKAAPILDVTIKHRALEVAKDLGIGVDQFKASMGWIEKFRERHKLPKPVVPAGLENSSDQLSPEDEQSRAEAFRSGFELATSQQGQHAAQFQQSPLTNQMEQDVGMFYSPQPSQTNALPNASTPQRPRSASNENNMNAIQETPKASKRHYDDMANHRGASPIDATMARMHLPNQNLAVSRLQREQTASSGTNNGVHQHDDSGYAMATSSSSSSSSAATGATKRRRGAATSAELSRGGSGNGSADDATNEGNISMNMIREQLRRSKNNGQVSGNSALSPQANNPVAIATAAAVQELRRDEHARSMHEQRLQQEQMQSQRGFRTGNPDGTSSEMMMMQGLQRAVSSPTINLRNTINAAHQMQQQHHPHHNDSPSSMMVSPPSVRHDLMGLLQSTNSSSSGSPSGAGGDDRPVTLDEARESLDVVLAFITRQPSQLSPSDYFVLGNLQGQLNALAQSSQDSMFSPGHMQTHQAPQQIQMPASQQSHPNMAVLQQQQQQNNHQFTHARSMSAQHPSSTNMNMLGITGEDISMANDLRHR
ncbi:uncharacterized protein FA14DRAFT_176877 [Meira miltonrushii]|uniref:HTH CENPB-type domain-containing protein n=1 Tax=Meira miltonrushii TaxID=1280837 RepID=A0A316VKK7_9BASI|nr:uncharacterized protein FA14DRAFT_176877 [Meira miltonrushii]PWN37588.1 hypothetical protein FA14DRAFT_176877 [Meira miltonrushii]